MFLGVFETGRPGNDLLQQAQTSVPNGTADRATWSRDSLAIISIPRGIPSLDEPAQPFHSPTGNVTVFFEGKIHNLQEIKNTLGLNQVIANSRSGEALAHLYELFGDDFLEHVNGKFAFALWDELGHKLLLGRDRLGIESVFYTPDGQRIVFGSSLHHVVEQCSTKRELNHEALLQYLLYCYNPLNETIFKGVRKLPAGHLLTHDGSDPQLKRYWYLSYANPTQAPESEICEEFLDLFRDAVRIRLDSAYTPGLFLSGGTDSSAILSLTSELSSDPIRTFGFRCRGPSYDESSYARWVAEQFNAQHTEVEYGPDRIGLLGQAAAAMEEPFCDLGIEIATFLLGQAAQGSTSFIFSGEGGDELFGGHPVYTADKVAPLVDIFPNMISHPVAKLLQRIPDTEHKKNIQVMLKRFSYSLTFPQAILSHRWRTYYTQAELRRLCTSEFLAECDMDNVFDGMARFTREADDKDRLSRSLYSDHFTLVDFYLRRLALLRSFGLESRAPLLDHRLAEYAATIPARLKVKGLTETKHIYRKLLEPILPRKILYDRPKLGHSVPMKNWMREDSTVKEWLQDMVFSKHLSSIEAFDTSYIKELLDDHFSMRNNNSHRLWALATLATWLEHHG